MITKEISLVCPICSWNFDNNEYKSLPYSTRSRDDKSANRPHSICFCKNCGVGIAFPLLTDEQLKTLYEQGNFWRGKTKKLFLPRKFPAHYALAKSRWKFLESYIKKRNNGIPISILDIGAGHGFFGMVAAKNNYLNFKKYSVIEKDETFRESLKITWQKYFPKIRIDLEDSLEKIKGEFDLIILSNILEHFSDPQRILNNAVSKLAGDGLIFIDIPNQDYLFRNDLFPHQFFFNKSSLEKFLDVCGLDIILFSCYGKDMNYSPINYQRKKEVLIKLVNFLYKARHIIPIQISSRFYSGYFGTDKQSANGTWLRVLAKKGKN